MAAIVSHSPLEKFLLFETIDTYDDEPPTFATLSESLKSHEALRERANGEISRLEPEALKGLYMGVINEERKTSGLGIDGDAVADDDGTNGDAQPPPLPTLESIEKASHHQHILPQLLNRLYFQYRDHAIKEIEEDERQYRTLKDQIEELQRKERDAQAQHDVPVRRDSRGISSIQHLLQHDPVEDKPDSSDDQPAVKGSLDQTEQAKALEDVGEAKATSSIPNGNIVPTTMPPTTATSTQVTESGPPSQGTLQDSPAFYPATQQPVQGYTMPSPKSDISRKLTHPSNQSRPNLAPSPGSRLNQGPFSTPDRGPTNSPIILPPPPGMRHPGSPPGALDTLADLAGQQYRGRQPLPSPRSAQAPASQHIPQYSQHHTYPPRPYGYYEGQTSYSSTYSPYSQGQGVPYSKPNPPAYSPYAPSAPNPAPHPQYSNVPYQAYPQFSPYGQTPHYPHTPRPAAFGPPSYPASAQHTPIAGSGRQRPPKPSPIVTSTSSTRWKNIPDPISIKRIGSPTRPSRDEISPISDSAPSPPPSPSISKVPTSRPTVPKRDKNPRRTAAKEQAARLGNTTSRPSGRRGSTASRPSTRSQSVTSPSANEEAKATLTNQNVVKNEPPATPAADTADETASVISTTADETTGTRKSGRRRRDTMRGLEAIEAIRGPTATKRKRASTQGTSAEPPTSTPAFQPNTSDPKLTESPVIGARNFPRTSATIMSEVASHKLAGMFARPLTEKEAPGYKGLIYRPQDLKSIKGAIVAGNRALVAADSSGENNVILPATADVVPPKGIVNSAQLENELMRMFANAVMFNPDPKRSFGPSFAKREARHIAKRIEDEEADELGDDEEDGGEDEREEEGGVVGDTREMYEAVERSVENWRAAEDWVGASGTPARGTAAKSEGSRVRGGEETEADEAADEETPEVRAGSPAVAVARRRRR